VAAGEGLAALCRRPTRISLAATITLSARLVGDDMSGMGWLVAPRHGFASRSWLLK
jgi:hypothetical protein